jgi:hypothetical protein
MASDKQIDANRLNAQKSTGPRTEAGRAISRLNAIKHGLTGHLYVMTDDERQARDTFVAGILDSLKPADAIERQLAHSVADGYWRINRVAAIENNFLAADAYNQELDRTAESEQPEIDRALAPALSFIKHPERFQLLGVYEMRLHRKIRLDLQQLREIQATRRAAEAMKAEQEQAAGRRAFDESCALLELNLRQDDQLDLDGKFTHPNGSVYSIPKLLDAMAVNRRMQHARKNLVHNPFTAAELESFLPAGPAQ